MFHPEIIARRRKRVEKSLGRPLIDHPPGLIRELSAALDTILDGSGKPSRPFTPEEARFVENEVMLSSIDFSHWSENYAVMQAKGGGLARFNRLWESQVRVLAECARIEHEQWSRHDRGETVFGIRILNHKARQMGLTQVSRALIVHAMIFNRHMVGLSASVSDAKVQELYDRDKLIYDNLPWWMKPEIAYDVKAESLAFRKLNTRMTYEYSYQKSLMGQGRDIAKAHLTECASWEYALNMIELGFMPSLAPSLNTLCILESTAEGRGNWWHTFTEHVRIGRRPGWSYVFIPWYIERSRYRATPPTGWQPGEMVLRHAKMVEATSPQWTGGKSFTLDLEQMYYYEMEWEAARDNNTLNLFHTSYPATPEEGFQHSTQSAFPQELISHLEDGVDPGDPYEVLVDRKPPLISPVNDWDGRDPLGILFIYEPPKPNETYVVGVDPAGGIQGWNRIYRPYAEGVHDNAVIEVVKVGRRAEKDGVIVRLPDEQVAEFAAPLNHFDMAEIASAIGRFYAGRDESGMALMIVETLGVNITAIPEFTMRHNYYNQFIWKYLDGSAPKLATKLGWQPTADSNKALFMKSLDHLGRGNAVVRSKWLIEEFKDCTSDWVTAQVRAKWGRHDDRVRAFFMALWAAHDWTTQADQDDFQAARTPVAPSRPWAMDVTSEEMADMVNETVDSWFDD